VTPEKYTDADYPLNLGSQQQVFMPLIQRN